MQRVVAIAAGMLLLAGCSMQVAHPRGLTDEQRDEFLLMNQAQQWDLAELDGYEQPVIEPQPVPENEYAGLVNRCLGDAGFGDSYRLLILKGSLYYTKSPDRPTEEERLALYVCTASFALPAEFSGYFSTDELAYAYDYYRDLLIPCLANHGYDVSLVPTRNEFTATPGYLDWNPYYQLPTGFPPERLSEMEVACPYLPPELH